jgi:hypothetical protein
MYGYIMADLREAMFILKPLGEGYKCFGFA